MLSVPVIILTLCALYYSLYYTERALPIAYVHLPELYYQTS